MDVRHGIVRTAGLAVASAMVLVTAACGGDAEAPPKAAGSRTETPSATPTPTAGESPSAPASASATPTPSPTRTARPLSPFEDEPQVMVLREWAVAMARGVNADDRAFEEAAPYMTKAGRRVINRLAQEDIGQRYPGPMPFTPTAVTVDGRRAEVAVCWWGTGFALDPKTKKPARKHSKDTVTYVMKLQGGRWLLHDSIWVKDGCGKVRVKGERW